MMFHTNTIEIYSSNYIERIVYTYFEELKNRDSHYQVSRGSPGWILYICEWLIISSNMNTLLSGSSYVELQKKFNLKNHMNLKILTTKKCQWQYKILTTYLCFIYCILYFVQQTPQQLNILWFWIPNETERLMGTNNWEEKKFIKGYKGYHPSMAINVYNYDKHYKIRSLVCQYRKTISLWMHQESVLYSEIATV